MCEAPLAVTAQHGFNVVARILHRVAWLTITDLNIGCIRSRAIYEMVSGAAVWKPGAHARCQYRFPRIVDKSDRAGDDVDKLVLSRVSVVKCGNGPRRECHVIHPKALQTKQVT